MMYEEIKNHSISQVYPLLKLSLEMHNERQRWAAPMSQALKILYTKKETRAVDQNPPSSTSLGKPAPPFSMHNTDGGNLWKKKQPVSMC